MTNARERRALVAAKVDPPFAEAPAWRAVGPGWRPLFGSFRELGFSFEWHDFKCKAPLDWARSFHPGGVELCLNLAGRATVNDGRQSSELQSQTLAFYHQGDPSLVATRSGDERHQFITVEFAPDFLVRHLTKAESLHPLVRSVVRGEAKASVASPAERMN